jgi:hypothetical protein
MFVMDANYIAITVNKHFQYFPCDDVDPVELEKKIVRVENARKMALESAAKLAASSKGRSLMSRITLYYATQAVLALIFFPNTPTIDLYASPFIINPQLNPVNLQDAMKILGPDSHKCFLEKAQCYEVNKVSITDSWMGTQLSADVHQALRKCRDDASSCLRNLAEEQSSERYSSIQYPEQNYFRQSYVNQLTRATTTLIMHSNKIVSNAQVPEPIQTLIDPHLDPEQFDHALTILWTDFKNCSYLEIECRQSLFSKLFDQYVLKVQTCSERIVSCMKSAWRKVSRKYHPDKNISNRERAQEAFTTIEKAYTTLKEVYF